MSDESMKQPPGKTCSQCFWFKSKCEWLISCAPSNTTCDWSPSRFLSSEHVAKMLPPREDPK